MHGRRLFSMPIYHASIMVVITDSNDSLIYVEIIQTNNAVMKWLYANGRGGHRVVAHF